MIIIIKGVIFITYPHSEQKGGQASLMRNLNPDGFPIKFDGSAHEG